MRTLEILEYCDSVMRGVTVSELADRLDYPQSSTSTLVQSMINSGYLALDADKRSLTPTGRVASLGQWIEPAAPRADVKTLMERLGEETGQTILLGVVHDLCVRYVDVVPGRRAMRLDLPIGTKLPLVESGMGRLLLSQMEDGEVLSLLERTRSRVKTKGAAGVGASAIVDIWNANPTVPKPRKLLQDLAAIRSRGFEMSLGRVSLGAGIICVALPRRPLEQPTGLGIGGLSASIGDEQQSILNALARHGRELRIGFPKLGHEARATA
jgi:DNA-binding IclR family transcriptional regulator